MNKDSLRILLATSRTLRGHTMSVIKHQTVGHHTYRVMVILHWLYAPAYPPQPLVYAALVHDMPEVWTGDMPGDIKHEDPDIGAAFDALDRKFYDMHQIPHQDLPEGQQFILNICDRADLYFWMQEEMLMGNCSAENIMVKARKLAFIQYQKYCDKTAGIPEVARLRNLMDSLA